VDLAILIFEDSERRTRMRYVGVFGLAHADLRRRDCRCRLFSVRWQMDRYANGAKTFKKSGWHVWPTAQRATQWTFASPLGRVGGWPKSRRKGGPVGNGV